MAIGHCGLAYNSEPDVREVVKSGSDGAELSGNRHCGNPTAAVAVAGAAAGPRSPWAIILACFIGTAVSVSPAFLIPFGLYIKPMSAELGWSRSQLALGVSIVALVAVAMTPICGALIDRFGTRPLAWVGAVAMPVGLIGLGRLPPSYPFYALLAAYMGVVATAGSPMTYVAVLPQWIDARLGRAIAFSMVGLGVGQILNSAATGYFIAHFGWRAAWMISALLIGPLGIANCLFLFRDSDAFISARREPQPARILAGLSFAQALRQPVLWFLGVAATLVCTVAGGISTHSAAILTDRGAAVGTATVAVMLLGMGSLTGRLLTGLLLDHIGFSAVGAVSFGLQGLGLFLLWQGAAGRTALMALFVVGVATGAESDIIPFALRRTFGMRAFGKLFGVVFALYQLGPVFGAPLMGAAFDRTGSYAPMLGVFAGFSFIAAVLTFLCGRMRRVAAGDTPPLPSGIP